MPAFKYDKTFIGFAAMRNHIGLYPFTGSFVAAHRKELSGYSTSKSAIRLPLDKPLPISLIKKIVKLRIKETKPKSLHASDHAGKPFMTVEDHFREAYREGSTPWDLGEADCNLVQVVTTQPIPPCKALDIGCGTGDNAIWLCQQNFDVVAVDISEIAIEKASEKAATAKVTCRFAVLDIPRATLKDHRLASHLIEAVSIQ